MAVFGRRQPHRPMLLTAGPPASVAHRVTPVGQDVAQSGQRAFLRTYIYKPLILKSGGRPATAKLKITGAALAAAQQGHRPAFRASVSGLNLYFNTPAIGGSPPVGVYFSFGREQSREAALFVRRVKAQTQLKGPGKPPPKNRLEVYDKASRDAANFRSRPLFPAILKGLLRFAAPPTINASVIDTANPSDSCHGLLASPPNNQLSPDPAASQRTRHNQQRHARSEAGYTGQETITTLGTVGTGQWQGEPIAQQFLQVLTAVSCCATLPSLPAYTYDNGKGGVGATITFTATGTVTLDSHKLALGDTVLVPYNQVIGGTLNGHAVCGIYSVTTKPDVGVQGVLTRHPAFQYLTQFSGAVVTVIYGGFYGDSQWFGRLQGPLGNQVVLFQPLMVMGYEVASQVCRIGAGAGLSLTQGTGGPSFLFVLSLANTYSALIGDGVNTTYTITQATHGLKTNGQMIVQLYDATTGIQFAPTSIAINNGTGTVTIVFGSAPASNAYRVVIMS